MSDTVDYREVPCKTLPGSSETLELLRAEGRQGWRFAYFTPNSIVLLRVTRYEPFYRQTGRDGGPVL